MDEMNNTPEPEETPARFVRRKRDKVQEFKEAYLPFIIAGVALLLILVFIIGSVSRAVAKGKADKEASIAASAAEEKLKAEQDAEAERLMTEADYLAEGYDYLGAIAAIDRFSGNIEDYPLMNAKREAYIERQNAVTAWNDPAKIPNLAFQLLIADPSRAFHDKNYSVQYKNNFITTDEFSAILQQLYDNNYMLVNLTDFVTVTQNAEGNVSYEAKTLYLPDGKKPIMLTEMNVNYYSYMIDGNSDGVPDKDGAGFASKLMVDASGKIVNEIVDANGNTVTGAYDMVPILDAFIAEHPDFSFRGARATIALTGSEGLFGYHTEPSAKEKLGEEAYKQEVDNAGTVAEALRNSGYIIACYTYDNIDYKSKSLTEVQNDLKGWAENVTPILGKVDTLVYARNTDISTEKGTYSGEKFSALYDAGFRCFIGQFGTESWADVQTGYVRQVRIPVSGSGLINTPSLYEGLFDASTVKDSHRG